MRFLTLGLTLNELGSIIKSAVSKVIVEWQTGTNLEWSTGVDMEW